VIILFRPRLSVYAMFAPGPQNPTPSDSTTSPPMPPQTLHQNHRAAVEIREIPLRMRGPPWHSRWRLQHPRTQNTLRHPSHGVPGSSCGGGVLCHQRRTLQAASLHSGGPKLQKGSLHFHHEHHSRHHHLVYETGGTVCQKARSEEVAEGERTG
jgi:hypothetical protein